MTLSFNEKVLTAKLDRLALPLRVIFAATIAERLLPLYVNFTKITGRGNPERLMDILQRLWLDLCGTQMSSQELQENIALSMNLIPGEDEVPWVPEQAWAEDAVATVAYSLRCRQSGQSQECVWVARRAYEALDHFVITTEGLSINAPEAEARALSNPLIQAELRRQSRDLRELQAAGENIIATSRRMRERAKKESSIVLKLGLT